MNRLKRLAILFLIGGVIYFIIELLWRGYSHPSMFVVGGICFLLVGGINEWLSWDTPLPVQCLIATAIITAVELLSGSILNLWLNLGVWDYSSIPFNLWGQICLLYSVLWYFLSAVGIVLDDFIRWRFFGEHKPRYILFHFRKG